MRGVPRVAITIVAVLSSTTPATGASHRDSVTQPANDGCGRDPIGLVTTAHTPQWVYVNRDPRPKYIRGTVVISRPTNTDNFRAHDSYDMNWNVKPGPAYESFLSTANMLPEDGIERGTIHNEWEQRAYPLFAWPTVGDDVEMLGAWIWDCGHWSSGSVADPVQGPLFLAPGTQPGEDIRGEKTEIHPPRMMVVHRKVPTTSSAGTSVTDVVISSQGTLAHAVEEWAAGRCAQPLPDSCPKWQPVNDRDYAFDVRAPAKPSGATKIVYRVVDRGSKNAPKPRVTITGDGVHVSVPFKDWGKKGMDMLFEKSIRVGWNAAPPVHHYRVALKRLDWLAELDGPETGYCNEEFPCTGSPQFSRPPDETNLFVDVGGQWRQVARKPLLTSGPGDTFTLHDTFDVYVKDGATFRVFGRGRECDQIDLAECPTGDEEGFDNDAGVFNHAYTAGRPIAGTHVGVGVSNDCTKLRNGPCYRLTYSISDLGVVRSDLTGKTPVGSHVPLPNTDGTATLALVLAGLGLALLTAARRPRRKGRGSK